MNKSILLFSAIACFTVLSFGSDISINTYACYSIRPHGMTYPVEYYSSGNFYYDYDLHYGRIDAWGIAGSIGLISNKTYTTIGIEFGPLMLNSTMDAGTLVANESISTGIGIFGQINTPFQTEFLLPQFSFGFALGYWHDSYEIAIHREYYYSDGTERYNDNYFGGPYITLTIGNKFNLLFKLSSQFGSRSHIFLPNATSESIDIEPAKFTFRLNLNFGMQFIWKHTNK